MKENEERIDKYQRKENFKRTNMPTTSFARNVGGERFWNEDMEKILYAYCEITDRQRRYEHKAGTRFDNYNQRRLFIFDLENFLGLTEYPEAREHLASLHWGFRNPETMQFINEPRLVIASEDEKRLVDYGNGETINVDD